MRLPFLRPGPYGGIYLRMGGLKGILYPRGWTFFFGPVSFSWRSYNLHLWTALPPEFVAFSGKRVYPGIVKSSATMCTDWYFTPLRLMLKAWNDPPDPDIGGVWDQVWEPEKAGISPPYNGGWLDMVRYWWHSGFYDDGICSDSGLEDDLDADEILSLVAEHNAQFTSEE